MTNIEIVVAADEQNGIGKQGEVPWRLPTDLAFLKRITSETRGPEHHNAVLMGRVTWETIPAKWQPLPRRLNAVVTRRQIYRVPEGVIVAHSIGAALEAIHARDDVERIFCLGGAEIYRQVIQMPTCRVIHLTRVEGGFDCDASFPDIPDDFALVETSERHEENGTGFVFQTWERGRATILA